MSLKDLQRDVPEAVFVGPAILENYALRFTMWSEKRAGGVADIIREKGQTVEGVLFEVPHFDDLDRREGHPSYYRRIKVEVVPVGQTSSVEVATYEVVNKELKEITPSKGYANIILEGAKELSKSYQENLKERFKGIV